MSFSSSLFDLLFPPKCPFCGRLLEEGQTLLCSDCQRDLPWTQGKAGERKGEFITVCVAPLWYRDTVRESHHRFKFYGVRAYTRPYVTLMAQCVNDHLDGEFDVLTWAPVSWWRRYRRGYDQAQLLAERLAAELDMPCQRLLRKKRHTKAQSSLKSASERRANVLGAYAVRCAEQVQGKRVLLVDDVMTSGATLSECARILLTAGAKQVSCVTLAMTGEGTRG